jgi:hypothetical protein
MMDLQWHLHDVFGTVFNVHYKEIYGLWTNGLSDNIACHVERVEKLLLQENFNLLQHIAVQSELNIVV